MKNELRLRHAFSAILASAAIVPCATACGGETEGSSSGGGAGVTATSEFRSACAPGVVRPFLQGLTGSPALDGATYRVEVAFPTITSPANNSGGNVVGHETPSEGDHWTGSNSPSENVGTLCATAKDRSGCLAKVQGYRILPTTRDDCKAQYGASFTQENCTTTYILYTRGDEIGVARTPAETRALMGTVDTVEEALHLAQAKNLSLSCVGGASYTIPNSRYRTTSDGGFDLELVESQNCGSYVQKVGVHVDAVGNVSETSRVVSTEKAGCAVAGRRPEGLLAAVPSGVHSTLAVGAYFASMATLEAAAVIAFRRLHRQLKRLGAPEELLGRVKKAVRDEIRHARAVSRLARKYGVTPEAPLALAEKETSLFAIALENAREGCVRETYGALLAQVQRSRAGDAEVRAVMAQIADEETEHAALSWDIADWIDGQLDDAERERLAQERRESLALLDRDLSAPVDARVRFAAGIPDAAESRALLARLAPSMRAA